MSFIPKSDEQKGAKHCALGNTGYDISPTWFFTIYLDTFRAAKKEWFNPLQGPISDTKVMELMQ